MKSERHAARIALFCWGVGFCAAPCPDGVAAFARNSLAGAGSRRAGSACGVSIAAGVATAGSDSIAVWQGASIEIFYADCALAKSFGRDSGWYWWACQPTCLPGAVAGPFANNYLAYRDALGRPKSGSRFGKRPS
jgi:hypothetical protein